MRRRLLIIAVLTLVAAVLTREGASVVAERNPASTTTTAHPFADAVDARPFLAGYLQQIAADPTSRLDPGEAGTDSGYALHDDIYELQFAAADEANSGTVDPSFEGTWRVLSARLFYDAGGGGSVMTGGLDLALRADGSYSYGAATGAWSVSPIATDDWTRWQTSPYGPTRKITFDDWQPGEAADGPVEETTGQVDFIWAIFRAEPPVVGAPGMIQIKFGRA